jgi:hypothetical protein
MDKFYARTVLFVRDAVRALEHYTGTLGFSRDWVHEEQGRPYVFQVSLHGAEIILNQAEAPTLERCGHGRVFVGLEDDQSAAFVQHVQAKEIPYTVLQWGAPTIVVTDLDGNELFFWLADAERKKLEG